MVDNTGKLVWEHIARHILVVENNVQQLLVRQ